MTDDELIAAMQAELPDTSAIELRVRRRIAREAMWRQAAAGLAIVLVFSFSMWRMLRPDPVFAAAARDHQREVVEQQPRRWKTGSEMPLQAFGLTPEIANRFAAAGYQLEHAKTCGLDGQRSLHLVYSNGRSRFSLYLRPGSGSPATHAARVGQEQVAGFAARGSQALLVTTADSKECESLARTAAAYLN